MFSWIRLPLTYCWVVNLLPSAPRAHLWSADFAAALDKNGWTVVKVRKRPHV